MHDPSRALHLQQPLPIPRAPRFSFPCAPPPSLAPHHLPLDAGFCLAPGVRCAASPERVTSATSVPRRPRRLHRLPARRTHPLPTPHSAPNLSLPRTTNTTGTIPRIRSIRCSCPPIVHTLPASPVHPQPYTAPLVDDSARRLPITSAGCVCLDDSATGWRGTDHTEAMRIPCSHRYPPSALGISDKRGWGTATILGATNLGGASRTCAAPGFRIALPPVQFESPASAVSMGWVLRECRIRADSDPHYLYIPISRFPILFTSATFFTL
ncbi:hypothetical protein B0H14DRAFT_366919 [Mycena olivaceomarginata]|nr:hypothetical protein B0H14DRAFT_366919 [Mycena olivaceomarginata]